GRGDPAEPGSRRDARPERAAARREHVRGRSGPVPPRRGLRVRTRSPSAARSGARPADGIIVSSQAQRNPLAAMSRSRRGAGGFAAVLAFLIVEYGRPMDLIPALGRARPGMVVTLWLALALVHDYRRVPWLKRQYGAFAALLALMIIWVPLARNNYWAY